jgi:hypothetical protein
LQQLFIVSQISPLHIAGDLSLQFVSNRLLHDCHEVNLYKIYQLASFYVEVEWHKEYNVRRAFYCFASTNAEKLQPYLEKIDITQIK